jgi:hypothetical protein
MTIFGNTGGSIVLTIALFLTGCAGAKYTSFDESNVNKLGLVRSVGFELDPAYRNAFPDCVIVMPATTTSALKRFAPLVEASLAHHMTRKVSRVIGPRAREIAARQKALDLDNPRDQDELSSGLDCGAFLLPVISGAGQRNLLVWSQVQIALEIRMVRSGDRQVLWKARHVAERSRGGFPLSPVGIAVNAFSSVRFSIDSRDVTVSVVEDAVRRIVQSLPDARIYIDERGTKRDPKDRF